MFRAPNRKCISPWYRVSDFSLSVVYLKTLEIAFECIRMDLKGLYQYLNYLLQTVILNDYIHHRSLSAESLY